MLVSNKSFFLLQVCMFILLMPFLLEGQTLSQEESELPENLSNLVDESVKTDESAETDKALNTEEDDDKKTPIPDNNMSREASIVRDIRLSSFFELVTWLNSLELDVSGTRSDIEQRLFEHYNISPPGEATTTPQDDSELLIIIDSARESEFFRAEVEEEEYIRLYGNIVIRIENKKEKLQHIIYADAININRQFNTLTALGDINYTLVRSDGSEEKFEGDNITFNFKTWEGVFLGGQIISEDKLVKDSTDNMIYSGNIISRSDTDVVVFDGVSIFNARVDPPYYSLRGSKLWLLTRNEWAISNAALYIGNIPAFYIPFYFKNADRLFFRPALGLHTQKGPYFHSTTYIFGKPKAQKETFSVLQITNTGVDEGQVIDGLFLRPRKTTLTEKEEEQGDWMLKFLLDGYSRMGLYSALVGDFSSLKSVSKLNFRLGVAVTRSIFKLGEQYTNYTIHNGKVEEHWNNGYIFNFPAPYLRFELSTDIKINIFSTGSWALKFDLFSDTLFPKDFHTRKEHFSWDFLFGRIFEEEEETSSTSERTSLTWSTTLYYRPRIKEISPWLNINIRRINAAMDWKSKSKTLPEILQGKDVYSAPEAKFFYPAYLKAPDVSIALSGTILNYTAPKSIERKKKKSEEEPVQPAPSDKLLPPWEESVQENAISVSEAEDSFQLSELQQNIGGIQFGVPFSISLKYSWQSDLLINSAMPSKDWKEPEDINLDEFTGYSMLENKNTGSITYNLDFLDKQISMAGTLNFSVNYYDLLSYNTEIYTDTELERLRRDQFKGREQEITHKLTSKVYPFKTYPILAETVFTHQLENIIFSHVFKSLKEDSPEFTNKLALWDDEMIKKHTLSSTISTKWELFSQQASLEVALPPKDITLKPSYTFKLGPFTASASTVIKNLDEKEQTYDPLKVSSSLAISTWFTLSQSFTVGINENKLTASTTTIQLSFFQKKLTFDASLSANATQKTTFNSTSLIWETDKESEKNIALQKFSFKANLSYPFPAFWKNRITLTLKSNFNFEYHFIRFTSTVLNFSYGIDFSIYRFITLSLSVNVRNDQMYRYFPDLTKQIGVSSRNFFLDLLDSLNIFSVDSLYRSYFKLQSVVIAITHDLGDWTLKLDYTGKPKLNTDSTVQKYEWENTLNIAIQWKPISELKTRWKVVNDVVNLVE